MTPVKRWVCPRCRRAVAWNGRTFVHVDRRDADRCRNLSLLVIRRAAPEPAKAGEP